MITFLAVLGHGKTKFFKIYEEKVLDVALDLFDIIRAKALTENVNTPPDLIVFMVFNPFNCTLCLFLLVFLMVAQTLAQLSYPEHIDVIVHTNSSFCSCINKVLTLKSCPVLLSFPQGKLDLFPWYALGLLFL